MNEYIKKNYEWMLLNLPLAIMAMWLLAEPTYSKKFLNYAAYIAFSMFILVLSLNPLVRILPKIKIFTLVNKRRRIIGVAVFTYALFHFICFAIKKGGLVGIISWLKHPIFITGSFSLFIFLLLAITSNNYSVRKLGYKKWKNLHRLVYLTEFSLFIHLFLVNYKKLALFTIIPLVILQIIRKRKENKIKAVN